MSEMLEEFRGSVVAIVREDAPHTPVFAGTGIVVAPNAIITCRHVIENSRVEDPEKGKLCAGSVLCGGSLYRATQVYGSGQEDLYCLCFEALPGTVPAPLFRVPQLKGLRLQAVGYKRDMLGPRQHVIPDLTVIQDEQRDGRLQFAQLEGGAAQGFSGGPVMARNGEHRYVVGMLHLGGAARSTSRMIAVDPIVAFLAEFGIDLSAGELPSGVEMVREPPPAASPAVPSLNIHTGDIVKTDIRAGGSIHVGGDFHGSQLNVNR